MKLMIAPFKSRKLEGVDEITVLYLRVMDDDAFGSGQ